MDAQFPSDSALELASERAVRFLRAAGTNARVRRALTQIAYTPAHHAQGWRLVLEAFGHHTPDQSPKAQAVACSDEALEAVTRLDTIDGPLIQSLDAVLTYEHPHAAQDLIGDLKEGKGESAVRNVELLVERIEAMRDPEQRQRVSALDAAALEALADVGMNTRYWARLAALVQRARQMPAESPLATTPPSDYFRDRLFEVYKWVRKWSMLSQASIHDPQVLAALGVLNNPPP